MLPLPVEKGLLVLLINRSFCSLRSCLSASDIQKLREDEEEEQEEEEGHRKKRKRSMWRRERG